jgi:hypothetical protein
MTYIVTFRILDKKYAKSDNPVPVSWGVVDLILGGDSNVHCTTGRDGRCTVEADRAGTFPVKFRHENYRPTLDPPYITIPSDKEFVLNATRARF